MKEIYLVYAEAVPTKAAINTDIVGNADAIIFISAESQEEAPTLARCALRDNGYHLTTVLSVSLPTLFDVSKLDTQLIAQYHAAAELGYGFELVAHPREERHPDHPVEIRSLGSLIFDETKKH
jgi:hypothetical protein